MEAFGLTSEAARQHVRNARVEMLKAVRSIIDERISHLSQTEAKGTKVVVE
jgi:vacuolar-type H+-ATPase subunit E/Vma4